MNICSKIFQNTFLHCFLLILGFTFQVQGKQVVEFKAINGDMTPIIRDALDGVTEKQVKLVFSEGIYHFSPDYAYSKYCFITNHGNGYKKIIFPFEDFEFVEIEGNGSEFIFHGQVLPFLFERCGNVRVEGVTVDWDIPFTFLGEVTEVNQEEGWRDVRPFVEGFSWRIGHDQLEFPNIDGFNYNYPGSTLAFDAEHKRPIHGVWDFHSRPTRVEQRKGGILRFYEHLKHYPPVGSLLSSKGNREDDRYAPAFHVKSSGNLHFEDVIVHHALGMGFLMERSENATLMNCGVYLREGSKRVISSTADATHFCNCRGDILVEGCRFENMLDDGTNVHGTYVEVESVLDKYTLRVGFKHFEQSGFIFAEPGDVIWFIKRPSSRRAAENEIKSVRVVNDRFVDLVFKNKLMDDIAAGDVLENKTWNPTFTMRGCKIRNHRARNIVLKTPLRTIIEDNDFSSMMSAIFFRGETYFWFESGAVEDVVIRNNRFKYCAYSGMEHAILRITPRLGKSFDQTEPYDRNITFENNVIDTFDNRIVWADRVDGLKIRGNLIRQTKDAEVLRPNAYLFDFTHCSNVQIVGNTYQGDHPYSVKTDKMSQASLSQKNNRGF